MTLRKLSRNGWQRWPWACLTSPPRKNAKEWGNLSHESSWLNFILYIFLPIYSLLPSLSFIHIPSYPFLSNISFTKPSPSPLKTQNLNPSFPKKSAKRLVLNLQNHCQSCVRVFELRKKRMRLWHQKNHDFSLRTALVFLVGLLGASVHSEAFLLMLNIVLGLSLFLLAIKIFSLFSC